MSVPSSMDSIDGVSNSSKRKKLSGSQNTLRSNVWLEFERSKDKQSAICKHCKETFRVNGTSSLRNHLNRCFMKKQNESGQERSRKDEGTPSTKMIKFCQERSRKDFSEMIVKHNYPFSMVEHEYFRKFVNNLQPHFDLKHRNTVRGDIVKLYKEEKNALYSILGKLSSRVSLTTDLWTAQCTRDSYMCLTVHYIDDDWVLRNKILNFRLMDCSQTGSELERIIMKCLFDWNVDKKVSTITVDNASSNDVMVSLLKANLNQDKLLVFNGKFFHIRCTTHILNLIVKDGLSAMGNTLNRIRESCKWNSTYQMISTALIYEKAFKRLHMKDEDFKTNPSPEEWVLAQKICTCLKNFYSSTMSLSGMDYPTADLYFSNVCEIHIALLEWKKSVTEEVKKMADSMYEKFKKYWSSCCLILAVAFVLNPGFKLKFVENYYSIIYGDYESAFQTRKVREAMIEIYSEYSPPTTNPLFTSQPSSSSSSQQLFEENSPNSNISIRFESWYQVDDDLCSTVAFSA
ncbi:hypothetical protein AQUCO_03000025v1 [Aquilegia coerulea]|uniref:BED-type domain-containing protein n=1 Tax=Aquilegia coerulea TaxID=218851 RepID=A0A2G5D0X7_AQUCA|nr:hypothetical protein AQUCO_03000025v1 [Aquilegia coerulea]